MTLIGLKRLAALALAATVIAGPLAGPAVAQTATTTPAAAEASATPAPTPVAPAVAAPAAAAPTPAKIDSGDTAWMLTSTALVLMMTIPGLALFYGGMVRRKNVIATVAQSFVITCLVTVLWVIVGYTIAFTPNPDMTLNRYIGGFGAMMMKGVKVDQANALAGTIPEVGDRFFFSGLQFTVSERSPKQVKRVRVARVKRVTTGPERPVTSS